MNRKALTEMLQNNCKQYYLQFFSSNKSLYFDTLPIHYHGTDYVIVVKDCIFRWLEEPQITIDTYLGHDHRHGQRQMHFIQQCEVGYKVEINGLEIPRQHKRTIKFYIQTFEPFGQTNAVTIIEDEVEVLHKIRTLLNELKDQFKIEAIDEKEYPPNTTGFDFYTDVIRKDRKSVVVGDELGHGYVYFEIARCHEEIKHCLLNALLHLKYVSDLMGRKVREQNKDVYLPNLSYSDYNYLIWVSGGLDRLFSFWDRITYVLANYEGLGQNLNTLSFDKYFKILNKKILNKQAIAFNDSSTNLTWLINFHKQEYQNMIAHRHRIVHYQITPSWEGVLSAKFSNNALEHITNESELRKLKLEFEGLATLLFKQFELCTTGFIKALKLIDELK